MTNKKHTILKYWRRPFPPKIVGLNFISDDYILRSFEFTESCKYILDSGDQYDWNKLFGFSAGLFGIHNNSARFAWRYNPQTNKIEIAAYCYIDGERYWNIMHAVDVNTALNYKISVLKDSVVFTILDDLIPVAKYHMHFNINLKDAPKYECGIYFGGNRRAPHRIKILEHYID